MRAVGFDADRLELTSDNPVPVVENVNTRGSGAANFALAGNGSLVYVGGEAGSLGGQRILVWVDREGREEPISLPPDSYAYARLSPDGNRVAAHIGGANFGSPDVKVGRGHSRSQPRVEPPLGA